MQILIAVFCLVIVVLGSPAYAAITASVYDISADKSTVALGQKIVFSTKVAVNQSFNGRFQFNLRKRDNKQDFQISSVAVSFVAGKLSTQQVSYLLPKSLPDGTYDLSGAAYFNNPWLKVGESIRTVTVKSKVFSINAVIPKPVFIWKDEFTSNLNDWVDHDFWETVPGGRLHNNGAVWFPIPAGNLASLSGGQLYLKNRKCKNLQNAPMCGAELTTWNSFKTFKHGKIEARVKIPGNADGFPAFWLLGNGTGNQGWPKGGEIDIFEFVNNGKDNGTPFFTTHWYGVNCNSGHCMKSYASPAKIANYTKDFHIWSFTRNANEINVSIDGKLWSRITRQDLAAIGGNYDVVFNEPMHLRLDLSSGGEWANDESRPAQEGDLIFDYIRVWSDAN